MSYSKKTIEDAISYRTPMAIKQIRVIVKDETSFPVCPKCQISLERDYQTYCDNCGQRLKWYGYVKNSTIIYV